MVWKGMHSERWGRNFYDYTTETISVVVFKDHKISHFIEKPITTT